MWKNFCVAVLLLASAGSISASEKIVHNDFFGDMKKITYDEEIKRYDSWATTNSKSLSDNFIELCCDLSETNVPSSTEIFSDTPEVAFMDIEYQFWARQELHSEIEQVMKRPSGEELLKVIASAYIMNPELQKIRFLTANILKNETTKRLSSEYVTYTETITVTSSLKGQISSQIKRRTRYIIYVNSSDKEAMYLAKDGSIKSKQRTKNDSVTHEMIHWMLDVSNTIRANSEITKNSFMTRFKKKHKSIDDKIRTLFDSVMQRLTPEQKNQIFENKYNNEQEIFDEFIKLLDHMMSNEYELSCMYGVVIDENYNVVGWSTINEMTTSTNDDVRISHMNIQNKKNIDMAMGFVAQMLQQMFNFYEYK